MALHTRHHLNVMAKEESRDSSRGIQSWQPRSPAGKTPLWAWGPVETEELGPGGHPEPPSVCSPTV